MRYDLRGECKRCGKCCDNEACEHLTYVDGKAVCLIYTSPDRPPKCGNFPSAPPIMIEGCGFYFYDTWEDRLIFPKEI